MLPVGQRAGVGVQKDSLLATSRFHNRPRLSARALARELIKQAMGTKDLQELRLRRERQKVEAAEAMADYKKAERGKFDRLARLRTERATREATQGPPSHKGNAPPAAKTQAKTKKSRQINRRPKTST